ncbi:Sec1 like protein [Babesia gibsoni]|uniref:Sec1 like protein n=1 Tax=Babesia gibsoni TaxID=33632 RepID=A0AAD8UW46_BABGI|nr:Sec1 like protein [Babesia gibsoni]
MEDDVNPYHFATLTSLMRENYASMLDRVKGLKLLILDEETSASISLVQTHSYLLENGVLLTTSINDDNLFKGESHNMANLRHLKAVYIIRPSHANIARLCDQIRGGYFKEYHLYFTSMPLHGQLEMVAKNDVIELVIGVYSYHTDLLAICRNCFLLESGTNDLYTSVHRSEAGRVSQGVFNVFRIIKQIPSIVHVNGSSEAKDLGLKVQSLLNNDLLNSEAILKAYSKYDNHERFGCCLLIYDRKFDCVTPLINQWTYEAMIHELLPITRNKLKIGEEEFILNPDFDDFYGEHLFTEFSDVEASLADLVHQSKKQFSDAFNILQNIPQQTKMCNETKRHVAILHELSKIIQQKQLLNNGLLEQDMGTRAKRSADAFDAVVDALNNTSIDAFERTRLAMIFCLVYRSNLEKINMVKDNMRMNGLTHMLKMVDSLLLYSDTNDSYKTSSDLLSKAKTTLNQSFMGAAASPYMQYKSRISHHVEALIKGQLDNRHFSLIPSSYDLDFTFKTLPASVVIYVIGGITMGEYRDLQLLSKEEGVPILLGGTRLINSHSFTNNL